MVSLTACHHPPIPPSSSLLTLAWPLLASSRSFVRSVWLPARRFSHHSFLGIYLCLDLVKSLAQLSVCGDLVRRLEDGVAPVGRKSIGLNTEIFYQHGSRAGGARAASCRSTYLHYRVPNLLLHSSPLAGSRCQRSSSTLPLWSSELQAALAFRIWMMRLMFSTARRISADRMTLSGILPSSGVTCRRVR